MELRNAATTKALWRSQGHMPDHPTTVFSNIPERRTCFTWLVSEAVLWQNPMARKIFAPIGQLFTQAGLDELSLICLHLKFGLKMQHFSR
jgi:hypothetical protein